MGFFGQKGFTVIELVIIVAILGTLAAVGLTTRVKQLDKAYNSQRIQDMSTIASALDSYYNDHNCYPDSVPFGSEFSENDTVYMKQVPNAPQTEKNGNYVYITDATSCPQWNIIFSKSDQKSTSSKCSLPPSCRPNNYTDEWGCKVSGEINCQELSSQTLTETAAIASSGNGANNTAANAKVTICHEIDSGYNQLSVSKNAETDGHDDHMGDIIPPFDYSCSSGTCQNPGKNWTTEYQAIYNNNCQGTIPVPTVITTVNPDPYSVGQYALDDTKLFQTYAVFFFDQPSFTSGWYDIGVSTDPTFPNDYTKSSKYFATGSTPQFGSLTSISHKSYMQFSNKLVAYQSLPYYYPFYKCGVTLYWKVYNFFDHTQASQTYSNVIDCTTKVGAFGMVYGDPTYWYNYYGYINNDNTVKPGQPYTAVWDPNNDGIVNWIDYIILSMNTKSRAGGWQPPE